MRTRPAIALAVAGVLGAAAPSIAEDRVGPRPFDRTPPVLTVTEAGHAGDHAGRLCAGYPIRLQIAAVDPSIAAERDRPVRKVGLLSLVATIPGEAWHVSDVSPGDATVVTEENRDKSKEVRVKAFFDPEPRGTTRTLGLTVRPAGGVAPDTWTVRIRAADFYGNATVATVSVEACP